ncbi:MAG: 30S ribosomal protein S4 [Thermomicrobiales bacterium]|nr:30S ribosomal protein S4 [Thermomicrobiales bacterium]MCO5225043.1 30S ribosomal protein S4 [Thermomicrobiales bacterium]MCO5227849.1 30S ribosomal protein S4 [Thermomicrobiales bacterium]
MNFTGPKVKKSRALGVALTPKAAAGMRKRPTPPGQHGSARGRRRRPSEYGVQLLEKQRLRFQYNISEKQLRRAYVTATRMPGSTGDNLLQVLESRMDALVLRAGFAPTIYAARQMVTHGHFMLNGKKATIPSMRLKPGDVISVRERSKKSPLFDAQILPRGEVAKYMTFDVNKLSARFESIPSREEIPVICAEHLVVEFYSR